MVSRRSFMWLTGAAAGLSVTRVSAQRGRSPGSDVAPGALAPSIAALTSMRDRARPITADERRARIERARKIMGEQHIDAIVLAGGCRMIKDAHEVALMRLACEATLNCYEAVFKALKPGMTQNQVTSLIAAAYGRLGFPGFASVQVGEYTALPHGSITPQTIREGTIIMIDDGCTVEGYQSDITRTFVLGRATDKMKRVFDIVHQAQTAALNAARPGVALEAIDAAGRKVVVDGGYGPGYQYFSHRLGHGMGMDGHEWPYLVKNNMYGWEKALKLQPGLVFSDEPGIYIRGEFGVRLEDDMHITADGAELLTPQSPSIESPFGA